MSPSSDIMVGGPRRVGFPKQCRGYVVLGPTSVSDGLKVILKNYSATGDYDVSPGNWLAQETRLPEPGDECLVIFDEENDAWVMVGMRSG